MSTWPGTTHVSVDVLALRLDTESGRVMLSLCRRVVDPFSGNLALPGVLLLSGERIAEAAVRALGKIGASEHSVRSSGQLVTFDEPNRDPRGPTLSVAVWAVLDAAAPRAVETVLHDPLPDLAFDHERIVADCLPLLAGLLWRDERFTRALTGDTFSTRDGLHLHQGITGQRPDRGNLNRAWNATAALSRTGRTVHTGTGRPGTEWTWEG